MQDVFSAWLLGLSQMFTVPVIAVMLIGVAIGFIVGLLPGLGGPAALALMLPFVFGMDATQSFAFLLGMLSVTSTMGDVTSILFGIPGEATTAATIIDGHAMTRNGEAGKALGGALTSSVIGGILGSLLLALSIPIIKPLVLAVGPPEMLVLALSGMILIAALSAGRFIEGVITACIGLLLGSIGLDPNGSVERFTFGQLFLWDGLGLVPITIGLFAIPEIIELTSMNTAIARSKSTNTNGVLFGVRAALQRWRLILRCSAIGSLIGALPGVGGSVSQWVAYAHALQSRTSKQAPGSGCFEGVLGPGSANNATLGGALLPTLAFGVPGSLSTAILLGAFLIQGLVPGTTMLTPDADGGKLSLTFSMVWMIAISNVLGAALCFLVLPRLVRITHVRTGVLAPLIMLLAFLGAYAERNAAEDMALMVAMGALGMAMKHLRWPRTPLLLGLILGPIAEDNLMLSIAIFGADWLFRPGVILIAATALAAVAFSAKTSFSRKSHRRSEEQKEQALEVSQGENGPNSRSLAAAAVACTLFVYAAWSAQGFAGKASLMPSLAATAGFAVTLLYLWVTARERWRFGKAEQRLAGDLGRRSSHQWLAGSVWVLGFYSSIALLGFAIGGTVSLFLFLLCRTRAKWPLLIVLPGVALAFVYGVVGQILHLPLPTGLLN